MVLKFQKLALEQPVLKEDGARRIECLKEWLPINRFSHNYENEGAVGAVETGFQNQITVTSKLPGRHHAC